VNLLSTTCVCVDVDFKTVGYNVADTKNQQLLCTIPLEVAPFGLIIYSNTNNYRCNTYMNNLDHVEIRITD
jgi:predicted HAD superfamily phosphohydrolase YqeG